MAEIIGLSLGSIALVGPAVDAYNTCTTLVRDARDHKDAVGDALMGLTVQKTMFEQNCRQLLQGLLDNCMLIEATPTGTHDEEVLWNRIGLAWRQTYGNHFDGPIAQVKKVLGDLEKELSKVLGSKGKHECIGTIHERQRQEIWRNCRSPTSDDDLADDHPLKKHLDSLKGTRKIKSKIQWVTTSKTRTLDLIKDLRARNQQLREARTLWQMSQGPRYLLLQDGRQNEHKQVETLRSLSKSTRSLARELCRSMSDASAEELEFYGTSGIQVGLSGVPGESEALQVVATGEALHNPQRHGLANSECNAFLVHSTSVSLHKCNSKKKDKSTTLLCNNANKVTSAGDYDGIYDNYYFAPLKPQSYSAGNLLPALYSRTGKRKQIFDRVARLQTAVSLALFPAYFGSYNPGWLRLDWKSSDIVIYFQGSEISILENPLPFLQAQQYSALPNQASSYRTRKQLLSLGIILIELAFRMPLQDKLSQLGITGVTDEEGAHHIVKGDRVLRKMGSAYNRAVRACVFYNYNESDADFDSEEMQDWFLRSVFEEVRSCFKSYSNGSSVKSPENVINAGSKLKSIASNLPAGGTVFKI